MPVYLVGGWYDSWGSNTTANFVALSKAIRGPVYLIMGPWIHGAQGQSSHGQVSFGPDAAIPDPLAWRREWYDHWLKGIDNSVGKADPFRTKVRIFVMGTGRRAARTTEGLSGPRRLLAGRAGVAAGARPRDQLLSLARAAGCATSRRPASGGATSFQFDPRHPVPTIGGNISSDNDIMLQGAWDQRGGPHVWNGQEPLPLSARNDVLVFQTEPLAEDMEVTGELAVKLWVSSSAVDTDFTAKLIDVYPPSPDWPGGFDLNIGDGILRTAVPRVAAEGSADGAGRDLPDHDQALSDVERLQAGPPHPRRHFQQQLPALRREPEHGRAAEPTPPPGGRRQHACTTTPSIRRTSCCR